MEITRPQLRVGDFAVFHGNMNSGLIKITSVSESGYDYVYVPSCVGAPCPRPLSDERIEACTPDQVEYKRREWLRQRPESVRQWRLDFPRAFDDAGLGVI